MKHITLLLILFIYLTRTMGQQVSVAYQSENSTLSITNHSGQEIILFSNEVKKDDDNVFEINSFKKNVTPSGITLPYYYLMIRHEKTHSFENVKPVPEKIVYFEYQIIDDKYALGNKKEIFAHAFAGYIPEKISENSDTTHSVSQAAQDSTQKVAPIEPVKPDDKPTPKKKLEPPPVVINPYREKVDKLLNESKDILDKGKGKILPSEKGILKKIERQSIELQKRIVKDQTALERKKANKKVKCPDCNELIKFAKESLNQIDILTGKIHAILASMTDEQIADLKMEYWNEVLTTVSQDTLDLQFIKTEVDKRNQHPLWGWVKINKIKCKLKEVSNNYELIQEKSALFIQDKLLFYNNNSDKAVILDLDKEIPTLYKDIDECEMELNNIQIPYTTLSLIGVVLLLLIAGIIVYVRSLLANKMEKRIKEEERIAGKSGLLIEDDEPIEVISYHVGLEDIREKAGVDYYVVNMDEILEETTIREVYLSRKAILDIYKFFSGFLKYDDKTNETGCFLVGRWDYAPNSNKQRYDISIESVVEPSDDAVYGEYTLNFGAKIGITLDFAIGNMCEKTGNEYVHTAWMHSHPGLGLFLSTQDLSVQSQLSHSQHFGRMLAIVLDSNSPDFKMAFFAPQPNGGMNNNKDVKQFLSLESLYQWTKTSQVKEEKAPQPPAPATTQNYFSVDISSPTNDLAKISITGSAIIDMDMAIMPDATGLRGYFQGEIRDKNLIINDFKEIREEKIKEKSVACFLVLPQFSVQETIVDPDFLMLLNNCDFSIIYCLEDEKLHVVANDELLTSLSLKEMKEWTRRKR